MHNLELATNTHFKIINLLRELVYAMMEMVEKKVPHAQSSKYGPTANLSKTLPPKQEDNSKSSNVNTPLTDETCKK